jgi:hypothetical protein
MLDENCDQDKFEVISLNFFNVISFYLDDQLYSDYMYDRIM